MAIRAVIWDMGGVLLRTEDPAPRQRLAEHLGIPLDKLYRQIFDSQSSHLAEVGEITEKDHWASVCAALDLSPQDLSEIMDGFWAGDRIDSSLVDYIRSLRQHYKTGLLSNAWDGLRQVLETRFDLTGAFDVIVISAEVGMAKPDSRIYQLTSQRLGVAAQEAVFIDDVPKNVEAARAMDMHAIQFQDPVQARAELEQILKG